MISENQLFDSLTLITANDEDFTPLERAKAEENVVLYIMVKYPEFDEKQIFEKYKMMVAQHILDNLALKGLIDEKLDAGENEVRYTVNGEI